MEGLLFVPFLQTGVQVRVICMVSDWEKKQVEGGACGLLPVML